MDDSSFVVVKPTYVKVAGWLLVGPATLGLLLPLPALSAGNTGVAVVSAIGGVVMVYALLAVNLNWPGALLAGGWGSLAVALLGLALLLPTNGLGLCATIMCAPVAVLMLGPPESRAWYRH